MQHEERHVEPSDAGERIPPVPQKQTNWQKRRERSLRVDHGRERRLENQLEAPE
jgi:hypothetical protein